MLRNKIGVFGLGTMGGNLALNLASKGHKISVYNRNVNRVDKLLDVASKESIHTIKGYTSVESFMYSLETPKKIVLMITAGKAVDAAIEELSPFIEKDDIIIDGGNEWYENTERRQNVLMQTHQAHWIGMGVSGGTQGARYGASIMPSGDQFVYDIIKPYISDIAAVDERDGIVCETYIGTGGSGHYVKMVHNGIEYGIMQVIAEVYDVLRISYNYDDCRIADFFEDCNIGINSYLLEITANVLRKKTGNNASFVEAILDVPAMNGTGTWTAYDSFTTATSIPIITTSIDARRMYQAKATRTILSKYRDAPNHQIASCVLDRGCLKDVLLSSINMCYFQGFQLIAEKNRDKQWGISIKDLAKIWKNGCIIRSTFLDFYAEVDEDKYLEMILMTFNYSSYRHVLHCCIALGIPLPCISACYQYILIVTQDKSPANLIQAQRNYFGDHPITMIDT